MAPDDHPHRLGPVRLINHLLALVVAFVLAPRWLTGSWLGVAPELVALVVGAGTIYGPDLRSGAAARKRAFAQFGSGLVIVLAWHWFFGEPLILGISIAVWILYYFAAPAGSWGVRGVVWLGRKLPLRQAAPPLVRAAHRGAALVRSRDQPLAVGLVGVLGAGFIHWVFASLLPGDVPGRPWALGLAAVAWILAWAAVGPACGPRGSKLGLIFPALAGLGTWVGCAAGAPARLAAVWFAWSLALVLVLARIVWPRNRAVGSSLLKAAVYASAVAWVALWSLRGFLSPNLQGTGDAKWYAVMLKDMVLQARAHGLPVWAGASEFQFNGAIYPLRVAPAFHYVGALLDLLTLRALPTIALLNLQIVSIGLAAALATYGVSKALLPTRPLAAALLTALFVSCPGVVGVAYNTDLYMSWMTLPFVPVAFLLAGWTLTHRTPAATGLLGLCLGLCWWGHSPIAVWTTVIAALVQGYGLVRQPPARSGWAALAFGAAVFFAVAAYPLGSVLFFPPETGVKMVDLQRATSWTIAEFIRRVFPAVLLPLQPEGLALSNFQLGYGLWAVLLGSFVLFWRRLPAAGRAFGVAAGALVLLLTPLPGWHDGLWILVPALIRNITGNWAMNRLYLVLAASVVVVAVQAVNLVSVRRYPVFMAVLGALALWSMAEGRKFAHAAAAYRTGPNSPRALLLPENTMVTSFAYLLFSRVPANFSHGVVAPELEYRFLSADGERTLEDGKAAAAAHSQELATFAFGAGTDGLSLEVPAPLPLRPDRHYLLTLVPAVRATPATGVLQLAGSSLLREYLLPDYGSARSFGLGGDHARSVAVWTSNPEGEELRIRFFPQGMTLQAAADFARLRVSEYRPAELPVRVSGWIPFRAQVTAPADCWFESPRMYQQGYVARVAGQWVPVKKSPEGLAMFRVPRGNSAVELRFVPPAGLQLLFYGSVLSILASAGAIYSLRRCGVFAGPAAAGPP